MAIQGTGHGGKQSHYMDGGEMVFFDFHGRAMHGFTSLDSSRNNT